MSGEEGAIQPEVQIRLEDVGGVWANYAVVCHSPYEFTIDFARLDFTNDPPQLVSSSEAAANAVTSFFM